MLWNVSLSSKYLPYGEQQTVGIISIQSFFFIIHCINSISHSPLKKISPFFIATIFHSVAGDVHSIKKLRSDDVPVEFSSANQFELLSNCIEIGPFCVSVLVHSTLNFKRDF